MKIDNRQHLLGEELKKHMEKESLVQMAAATFSMFAFKELKAELEGIEELQFIFTNPTFTNPDVKAEYREYRVPRRQREDSLFGAAYELKLMNELTQKALARECADWIRRKARFKTITVSDETIDSGLRITKPSGIVAVDKLRNFDRKELGYETSLFPASWNLYDAPTSLNYLREFETYWQADEYFRDVTEEVLASFEVAHKEQSPEFLYYVMLYNLFKDFLDDVNQDYQPNHMVRYKESKIWNKLYDFQKDAVESIIKKLEQYNGCILADSVGLGKTFTALAVMTYYSYRNKNILVLCPKKLEQNWNMYRHNYKNNPIYDRHLSYDVLFHTDLSRDFGQSNGMDLSLINWENYDLVVIDESHNFRNGGSSNKDIEEGRENRYSRLMNRVIRQGVKTKVLMLSATPVNNRFNDLKNQIALAYEGESQQLDRLLDTKSSIDDIFRQAQSAYNKWAELPADERTTKELLRRLDFDFFKVLDSVTIARSRQHIRNFYETAAIGDFPKRLEPQNHSPELSCQGQVSYQQIYDLLDQLKLTIYQPSLYIYPSKRIKYAGEGTGQSRNLSQDGREAGIKKLMMINLLKRLESSIEAFRHTLIDVVLAYVRQTLATIDRFEASGQGGELAAWQLDEGDLDVEDASTELTVGKKLPIDLADMDYLTWKQDLIADRAILEELAALIDQLTPDQDMKLQTLKDVIDKKLQAGRNGGNRKLIVFSAFATTTDYLYDQLSQYVLERYGLYTGKVSGVSGQATNLPIKVEGLNGLLTYFSPKSKDKALIYPDDELEIDLLIATDVISEGQNLQDADTLVNYDIHWNPVRIVQRFGRIDRIGSQNATIQLVNFWPNIDLDRYINLKSRVEARMVATNLTATADDNLLTKEEGEEVDYRLKQLERLKTEVVDLEEMTDGVSIMDLGLEDYRMDLTRYLSQHPELERSPQGLQAVLPVAQADQEGAIFVLKYVATADKLNQKNRLHPYYLVYVNQSGQLVYPVSEIKQLLDTVRRLTKGQAEPAWHLVEDYRLRTKDGAEMSYYSKLLQAAIEGLVDQEEEDLIYNLFHQTQLHLLDQGLEGAEDFQLICFFALLQDKEGGKTA